MKTFGPKMIRLLGVVLAVSVLTFLMVDLLPGDVAFELLGQDATVEDIEALRAELGLDRHVGARYLSWLGNVLAGDLGHSPRTSEPVLEAILARLPVTLELMLLAQILAITLALPTGIVSAYKARRVCDQVLSSTAFAAMSIPVFVMSLLLIYLFALKLGWLPATGYVPLSDGVAANLKTFMLPAVSIALVEWVPLMRVLRSDMVATLQEEFILTARAKGLPTWHILLRHALRPSSFTLVTILGLQIGNLIGGAVIIEWIFGLPGMGRLLINAIFARDAMMVQGCILFITLAYVLINFSVDMGYAWLDPRLRVRSR